jgi:AcrR family transcriptional regulator
MRRVASEIGTGAATLYRHLDHRRDLVDLMIDAVYGELELRHTGQGWLADLLAVGVQSLHIVDRHPWFTEAVNEQPVPSGPNIVALIEHCLGALAEHPAPGSRKMEAIAVLGSMMWLHAAFLARRSLPEVLLEQAVYLRHVARDGRHPHLAAALAEPDPATVPGGPEELVGRLLGPILEALLER